MKGRRAEENTETRLKVERVAGLVASTVFQTLGQVKYARQHGDRIRWRGVHMARDELEGQRARRTVA